MNVTIIGNGFSGAVIATRLLRQQKRAVNIRVIGATPDPGAGIAYATGDDQHLLNVPAGQMSAFPESPDDFSQWLFARTGDDDRTFARRGLYRQYVAERLAEASAQRGHAGTEIWQVHGEATSVDGDWVVTSDGQRVPTDVIILATGHHAKANFGLGASPYAADRWPTSGVSDVAIVGSGLSAVDAALTAGARYPGATITAISGSGLLPERYEFVAPWTGMLVARSLRGIFREFQTAAKSGVSWHAIFAALRFRWNDLWSGFSPHEREQFRRHLRARFNRIRHRLPPPQRDRLALSSQFRIVKAIARTAYPIGGRYRIDCDDTQVDADLLLDASGFQTDWRLSPNRLVKNLFDQGLLTAGPDGHGIDAGTDWRIRGADAIFAIGPMHYGRLIETTAVAELRQQAAEIVDQVFA